MEKKKKFGLLICIIIGGILLGGIIMGVYMEPVEEAPKQELVVGLDMDIYGLGPGNNGLYYLTFLAYNGLVELDADFNKKPGLAESWEMSEDGKEWTFHLRKDVKFHDGTECGCEDVKFSIEQLIKEKYYRMLVVKEIICLDNYTVKFVLKKPTYVFASDLSMQHTPIVSTTSVDESGKFVKAVGTGPFKPEEWIKEQKVVLVRNDEYWGGTPKLEKITFKIIPDPETRAIALETGEIDLMNCRGSLTAVSRLKEDPELKVLSKTAQTAELIFFRTQKEPFNDIRVRKAINYAIDVNGIITSLLKDVGIPAEHLFSSAFQQFRNPNLKTIGYNPEQAKRLLEEAGWKDTNGDGILDKNGIPFKVTLTFNAKSSDHPVIAEAIQAQLKKVGIDLELQAVEYAVQRNVLATGDYEMLMISHWSIPHDDPSRAYYYYYSKSTFSSVSPIFTNEKLDRLIDRFEVTIDEEERLKLHHEIQKEIMDNVPAVFLYNGINNIAMKKSVQDFEVYTGCWQAYKSFEKAWIE